MGNYNTYPELDDDTLRARCLLALPSFTLNEQILIMYRVTLPTGWNRSPECYAALLGVAESYELRKVWGQMEALRREQRQMESQPDLVESQPVLVEE
jgi:hypothetical protein